MRFLAVDPGSKPGFAEFNNGQLIEVGYDPERLTTAIYDQAVFEGQYATRYVYRNGRRQRVALASQQSLSFTAGRLFEKVVAREKFRINPNDWRRVLWPGSNRLPKATVLARLRKQLPPAWVAMVDRLPKSHRDDALEAVGIGWAWLTLTEREREAYRHV